MELRQRYLQAVEHRSDEARTGATGLTPSLLCVAAVAVLPVDAAGITITQRRLRLPLGSSDERAAVAERIQTTLGDGPCLSAAAEEVVQVSDADDIAERWPTYADELVRHTPFRSVAAVPLRLGTNTVFGALNLYAVRPDLRAHLPTGDAAVVGAAMVTLLAGLLASLDPDAALHPSALLDDPGTVDRMEVWTAVGMVMEAGRCDEADALALLRAYAYGHGLILDHVAARVLDRDLLVASLLG